MKNSIFNAVCKTRYLALLVVLILTCGNVWGDTVSLTQDDVDDNGDGKQSYSTSYDIEGWTGKYMVAKLNSPLTYSLQIGYNTNTSKGAYNSHVTTPETTGGATSVTIQTKGHNTSHTASGRKFFLGKTDDLGAVNTYNSETMYAWGATDEEDGSVTISISGSPTQFHIYTDGTAYIESITVTYSSGACVAPTSVAITGTTKYLGGQTISLTATPTGHTGTPTYQWEKKVSGTWTPLSNGTTAGVTISGATTNNLQISPCTHENSGGYRCVVSTGATCSTKSHADDNAGYGVHVYSIYGRYYNEGEWAHNEIAYSSGTTGTATIHLSAKKTYTFKVRSNNDLYYGYSSGNFIIQPATGMDCGTNNSDIRLFTTVEGDYTITVDIAHGLDNSPYVTIAVGYPSMSHPNSGYVYVQKFAWRPYLHYWYDNDHALTSWGSDPQLNSDQYTSICGTEYWYVPVIDYYCNFIAKDAAGDPSYTTGDQHTNSPHPGQRLYNDGTWKWADFTTYTISFEGGTGSTGSTASVNGICPGADAPLTANGFSKTGYQFDGWTPSATVTVGSTTYTTSDVVPGGSTIKAVGSNLTMTAYWAANTISITLDKNNNDASGSTSGSTSIKYDATAVLSSPTHATRTGYTLEGYYAEVGCTNKVMTSAGALVNYSGYVESGKWVRDVTPTTLYAKWTPIPYTVTWYVEGTALTGLAAGLTTVNYGSKVTGLPSTPVSTCDGTFMGWTTSADAVYNKNANDEYKTAPSVLYTTQAETPTITGNTDFYAVFKKRLED